MTDEGMSSFGHSPVLRRAAQVKAAPSSPRTHTLPTTIRIRLDVVSA